ncbi:hypothetical protein MSAN_00968000 [Mycena sanguinolenta]|uniref:Uncharacterized protein n=1 Tax=Mycena sanguinolenta TaxID=230812 RepID=A0A8H6YZE9_9AGAR|nr:hypothetical protein MSAN_00968000 [Mycena sanguinolenta]
MDSGGFALAPHNAHTLVASSSPTAAASDRAPKSLLQSFAMTVQLSATCMWSSESPPRGTQACLPVDQALSSLFGFSVSYFDMDEVRNKYPSSFARVDTVPTGRRSLFVFDAHTKAASPARFSHPARPHTARETVEGTAACCAVPTPTMLMLFVFLQQISRQPSLPFRWRLLFRPESKYDDVASTPTSATTPRRDDDRGFSVSFGSSSGSERKQVCMISERGLGREIATRPVWGMGGDCAGFSSTARDLQLPRYRGRRNTAYLRSRIQGGGAVLSAKMALRMDASMETTRGEGGERRGEGDGEGKEGRRNGTERRDGRDACRKMTDGSAIAWRDTSAPLYTFPGAPRAQFFFL